MPDLSDAEIIKTVVAGDRDAFRLLLDRHQGFVYSLARRLVRDEDDARDITQETFIRSWKNLPKFRPENKFTTWLYKIASNLCMDHLRAEKKKAIRSELHPHLQVASLDSPEQEVAYAELNQAVRNAIEHLPPKQKAAFVLRDLEGLEVPEVCDILGISTSTLKSNLYYARMHMGEALKKYYRTNETDLL